MAIAFLMANVIKIVTGIGILGALIIVHELGHFLLAKYFKVGVMEFAIGFGKPLWSKRIGETRYSLRAIPLGGYVRMVGDDPFQLTEASDRSRPLHDAVAAENHIAGHGMQLVEDDDHPAVIAMREDKSRWFLSKPYIAKMLVVLAGPGFNLIFAWLVAFGLYFSVGTERTLNKPIIGGVELGMPAAKAGITPGDTVQAVGGVAITTWDELFEAINKSQGDLLSLSVVRKSDGKAMEALDPITLELKAKKQDSSEAEAALVMHGQTTPRYRIGISPSTEPVDLGLVDSALAAWSHVYSISSMSFRSFGYLLTGRISTKNLSGPISIIQTAGNTAEGGIKNILGFMIFLSVWRCLIYFQFPC
jgi:regulator of sigma E protease